MTDATLAQLKEASRPSRIGQLIAEASRETGYTPQEIVGHSRKQPLARTRQWVMWKARQEGYSLEQIGRVLNRDHTTVLHGVRKIEAIS